MLGAIIGDIVGSRFEFNNHRSKEFDMFAEGCFATDDSIMTLAVAKAIMEAAKVKGPAISDYDDYHALLSDLTVRYMQEIGRKYPNCGFGGMFRKWVFSDNPEPYNSFGNGAAMRVSPAGFAAKFVWDAEELAETVTSVTHDHDEGIKGAKATAAAICMARRGALKCEIREHIIRDYYPLDFKIDDIRAAYRFNETCQETVPQAIECFLESTSFEDAIRTAISLGGDSDTIGAIAGAIAEAYYGVPEDIKEKALAYLDEELRAIYDEWTAFAPINDERFRVLTKYIGKIGIAEIFGDRLIDFENDGTPKYSIPMPYVGYGGLMSSFEDEFNNFSEAHPEYELTRYVEILERNGLKCGTSEMRSADVQKLDEQSVLALVMGAIHTERSRDGALLAFFKDGSMSRWLKRLKDLDWQRKPLRLSEIAFHTFCSPGNPNNIVIYHFTLGKNEAAFTQTRGIANGKPFYVQAFSLEEATRYAECFGKIHTEYWNSDYDDTYMCDGRQWELTVRYSDGSTLDYFGSNAYPENWNELLGFFGIDYYS